MKNNLKRISVLALVAVVSITSIGVVKAASELVAQTSLYIGHCSTATGSYRKYNKVNQHIDYFWKKVETGSKSTPQMTVELQKKKLLGLDSETVGTYTIYSAEGRAHDYSYFDGVGSGTYRLHHSTWGQWGAGTGLFESDNVQILTHD